MAKQKQLVELNTARVEAVRSLLALRDNMVAVPNEPAIAAGLTSENLGMVKATLQNVVDAAIVEALHKALQIGTS